MLCILRSTELSDARTFWLRKAQIESFPSREKDNGFINAFIQMIARKGANFVGAEKEMRKKIHKLDQDKIVKKTTQHHMIEWKFKPPSAPPFRGD